MREAKEEVGVAINPNDLKFVHVINRMAEEKDHERVDFFFEVLAYEGTLNNCEPHKCDDLRWFSLDRLPKNMTPEVHQALSDIQKGEYYSEVGF